MAKLHDMRLKLLIQQEHERISKSQPNDLDLSIVQARCLCWLSLLAEAHEDQANDAEKRGDAEQAMGWFADSMRLRDVINLVTSIEIPLPDSPDSLDENDELLDGPTIMPKQSNDIKELFYFLIQEPCQCIDCQRFYKEHERLIREFPTFKQQQELNWASIQSFRTLCSKVTEELQKQLSGKDIDGNLIEDNKYISDIEITEAIDELENVNAYLYSIEALMERIFDIKVSENIECKFKKISKKLALDPLNIDRLMIEQVISPNNRFT